MASDGLFLQGIGRLSICLASVLLALSAVHGASQSNMKGDRFTALAIPPSAAFSPTPVDIVVQRWSTEAEHDRLMTALSELGPKGFLDVLRALPRVGGFAATGSLGYPARYARRTKGPDGIERITIATDRDITFWEAANLSRSVDYPITLIELRVKPSGDGDGQVLVAAKVAYDKRTRTMLVENYDFQPVRLNAVQRLK